MCGPNEQEDGKYIILVGGVRGGGDGDGGRGGGGGGESKGLASNEMRMQIDSQWPYCDVIKQAVFNLLAIISSKNILSSNGHYSSITKLLIQKQVSVLSLSLCASLSVCLSVFEY